MKETLENQLEEIVRNAIAITEQTGEFVIEQAPMLLQEFYAWRLTDAIYQILLAVILVIVCLRIPYLWMEKEKGYHFDTKYLNRFGEEGGVIGGYAIAGSGAITGLIIFLVNLHELLFILIAPKIYLIEYFIR